MAKILLIMDSRGTNLKDIMEEAVNKYVPNSVVELLAVRGANLQSIETKALAELSSHDYDQAYIFLGVNNITKPYFEKQILLNYDCIPDLVDTMDDMFTALKSKLLRKVPKVIVCHLVGLDILRYNIEKQGRNPLLLTNYRKLQTIIDDSIPIINRAIDSMNMSSNVIGPWIEDTVHANINGKRVHKYLRLHDGLHPSLSTKKIWAKKLAKAFLNNT